MATAQGKSRKLDIHFSRQGTQGICQKYYKYDFTPGIYHQHREHFEVSKIKGHARVVVESSYNLLAF